MHRLRRLSRGGRLLLALTVGGAIFGIATAVQADIPDSGVIHACYKKVNGQLRVIDTSQGGTCLPSENALSWNQTGPTGPKGATGPTGPKGPTGPSDGWQGAVNGTVPTGGATVHIPGVSGITPGSYLISGSVFWNALASGSADLQCFLEITGGGGSATHGNGVASTSGGGSAPLYGEMSVSVGTASLGVACHEVSGTVSVFVGTEVHAIRVGTLH